MLASLKVRNHMCATKVTFTPDMEVLRAIQHLIEYKISGAPVIDHHGNLIGFLSEKDCMRVALNAAYQSEAGGTVGEFMTSHVDIVDVDASIIEAAEKFLQSSYKCYPVVMDNRLVGSITRQNILKALQTGSSPDSKPLDKQPTKQQVHVSSLG